MAFLHAIVGAQFVITYLEIGALAGCVNLWIVCFVV
jgi:hypothetical protein